MTKDFIYHYLSRQRLAVLSSIAPGNRPQAALIGIAVTEDLEIIFDTVTRSRKYKNMLDHPAVSLVIGWDNETTIQYEGNAELLSGEGSEQYKEVYYAAYPEGRERARTWSGLVHFLVRPAWIRYSNFNQPVIIEELSL